MSDRQLEVVDVLEVLETKLAYLPGGRDREGRPILLVNVPIVSQDCSTAKTKIQRLIQYLLSVFNEETKRNGVCVIVDARQGSWRVARSYIRKSAVLVGNVATRMIVIRPEGFWEKRVDNCTRSRKEGEPICIPMTRLGAYVETVQLPYDLGGTKFHDHTRWIQARMMVEKYAKSSDSLIAKMIYLRGKLCSFDALRSRDRAEVDLGSYWEAGTELAETIQEVLISGRNLLSAMSRESSQDYLDTLQRINRILDTIELEQVELEKGWTKLAENLDTAREINDLEKGLSQVTNWILGPADFMLNSHCQVGYDVLTSENLRKEHEELELECRNAYRCYDEVMHRINSLPQDRLTEDVKAQKKFMDFLCKSFATRLERRRNLLITSQRFFRLVSGYFDRTSEVFDKLVRNKISILSQASLKLHNLERSQSILDELQRQLVTEGEKFSEMLTIPIKNALGHDVIVDYSEDIVNVHDILDASNARKNIFNDSVELEKLSLRQMALIYAYENDAEEAVKWLIDLYGVIMKNHMEVGSHISEIQAQKEEHQTYQDTAKGTFDYGYQLANGARVLRISCRLELDSNTSLASRLRQAWRRIRSIGQEQLTRLRVCSVFHRSVDEHSTALNELIDTIEESFVLHEKSIPEGPCFDRTWKAKAGTLREVLEDREKLIPDVGRTVRLGKLLRTRLKEPLFLQRRMSNPVSRSSDDDHVGNLTAVDGISERLAEVTRLAEKLEARLYEAGARIRNASRQMSEQVNGDTGANEAEKSSEAKKAISDIQEVVKKIDEGEIEESITEDYMTATDCTTTPMGRSRSESFVTISEVDDCLLAANELHDTRQDALAADTPKKHQCESESLSSVVVAPIDQRQMENIASNSKMAADRTSDKSGLDHIERTTSTSIIERLEEKSGKIVKEVTETTTLRVSQDTRFGVASYKLTSNTLREAHENTDVKGILDSKAFGAETNGCGEDKLTHEVLDEIDDYKREEITLSDVNPASQETDHHSKLTTMIKETSQREEKRSTHFNENENNNNNNIINNNVIKSISCGLESSGNNDSGIEISPRKIGDLTENNQVSEPDLELLMRMKTSGEWLRLKVLEVQPELTRLGATVQEATKLSTAHDEVLVRLQSKQSPVEELLKQADQLISTQRPRAEVYAAMAETLGQAWRNVNSLLELRKQILDHNVLFQCRAQECQDSTKALEMACNDTLLPIEIEAVKQFLNKIHDLRKSMLSALMGALQEGKTLLDCLKQIANEGTLDSRPDRIKVDADHAVLQVEKWLEQLHDHRQLIEVSFSSRKTQLEQCLALALLATDLRDLEEILSDRIAALASSSDQLGDSASSAELLLFELKKLQNEAKEFQDRSIKITKSTERLVTSGHFAGEQATEQAYAILEAAADYVNDLDQYESLLNRAISFFELVRSAFTKIDQLEIQLATAEPPEHSVQLARLHALAASTVADATAMPLSEGYALLDITGRGAPGAEGVKRAVEELENRKIRILERCTAHKEENLRISRGIAKFFAKYDELSSWLAGIADAFLRGHQDMGSDLPMAKDFYEIHCQLLEDLGKRGVEIDEALEVLSGTILEIADERQRANRKHEVEERVEALRDSWLDSRNSVEFRVKLSALYVEFHEAAKRLDNEVNYLENEYKKNVDKLGDEKIQDLETRWKESQPLYMKLTNSGTAFIDEANRSNDAYLDVPRAKLCVETTLERFANRQLNVTEVWENWQTTVTTVRERRIEEERRVEESTRTLEWVSKFGEQLYPILTSDSTNPSTLLQDLESSLIGILPELKKAVTELDARIKSVESFSHGDGDRASERIKNQLSRVYDHLRTTASDYQILLESLISIFRTLSEVEQKVLDIKGTRRELESSSPSGFLSGPGRKEIRSKSERHEWERRSIGDTLTNLRGEVDQAVARIERQEPPEAAKQEIERLRSAMIHTSADWDNSWQETRNRLDGGIRFCDFADDLDHIDADLRHLANQLAASDSRFLGDSLPSAESASEAFRQFEKTIMTLEERISSFVKTTKENVALSSPDSPHTIHRELSGLQERWHELKRLAEETRKRIDLSIEYFRLLEEAKNWYRNGNKLLIVVARKATAAKVPEEAAELLKDVDAYLKPGEERQEKRIERIRELSTRIFGTDRLPQFNDVVVENRETLDSFAVITSELRTLEQNLESSAIELEDKIREKEREETALRKLEIARIEAPVVHEAEIMNKSESIVQEEGKQIIPKTETSINTTTNTLVTERKEELVVEKIVTSEVTTKEIHILQKTEVEEEVPVHMTPLAEPARIPEKVEAPKNVEPEVSGVPPEFVDVLNDATIEEGHRLTLECRLRGHPVPEVVWYKDGISILNNLDYRTSFDVETGSCTLMIEETFTEDSAKFTCKAFNILGLAETSANLTVKETAPEHQLSPPIFIKELLDSTAKISCTHILECTVTGNPLPTVQWYKNDTNIDDSPDYAITYNNGEAVLKFLEVSPEDLAMYTCRATNRLGKASTTASVRVELPEENKPEVAAPTILENGRLSTSPEPTHVQKVEKTFVTHRDETIEEKIIRESKSVTQIATSIEEMGNLSGLDVDGTSTTIPEVDVPAEIPECAVGEVLLPEEKIFQHLIQPSFQSPLKNTQVFEGRTAKLDCVIIGQPEPEVIWYHNDKPVKESADFQLLFQGDRCSLVILEAFLDDAGKYRVVAINSQGKDSSECVLSVVPASDSADRQTAGNVPQFAKLMTDALVDEGEDTIFECQVNGEPRPDLRWFFNNVEIDGLNQRIKTSHDESGLCTLTISPTCLEDKGNYVAKATNIYGAAKAIARLVVKPIMNSASKTDSTVQMVKKLVPPIFEEVFADRHVAEGTATKFECIVYGTPTPKIQWLFNDRPIHGKGFLLSVSGERQVLTVPEADIEHTGTVSCVAENIVGKATCTAKLSVGGVTKKEGEEREEGELVIIDNEMHPSNSSEKFFTTERKTTTGEGDVPGAGQILTKMSSSTTQSSSSHSTCVKEYKTSTCSSFFEPGRISVPGNNLLTKSTVESSEFSSQRNGAPPVVQSHKVEEFQRYVQDVPGEIRQEKTVVITEGRGPPPQPPRQKPPRRISAPRFVSPVTGMIVNQDSDVVLEGVIDGFPQPTVSWAKNGQQLKDNVKTTYEHNHVRLEMKNVNVKDAGRYTCTAINEAGNASSTADLVVKKTIFPPVFGKRLQAQVVKRGERVVMEVEITGTPEPTVTWYKDDVPIRERPPELRLRQMGNCYLLVIEKAEKEHAGKYMVNATNAGGEGQSIADFAVFEPTPDTMVEVHKTIVYENVQDKNIVQPDGKKSEIPSANMTAEHIATTMIKPSSGLRTLVPNPVTSSSDSIRTIQLVETKTDGQAGGPAVEKASRSEYISSTTETHQSETKSEQKFHMKLQHKSAALFDDDNAPSGPNILTTTTTKTSTQETKVGDEPASTKTCEFVETKKTELPSKTKEEQTIEENENVETSTIAKKDALSFFESMSKESDLTPRGPKAMVDLAQDTEDGNYDVKVDKLTKNYERTTKFEETYKPERPTVETSKKASQDVFERLEKGPSSRGLDNTVIDFPYEDFKLAPLNTKRTILEDTTASGSPIHGTLTISKLQAQSESAEAMLSGFNLVPEPPPEIGYMPKPDEESQKKRSDGVSVKAKQLQESHKNLSYGDAPVGGVKIFPTSAPKSATAGPPCKEPTKPKSTSIPPPFELDSANDSYECRREVCEHVCTKKDVRQEKKSEETVKTSQGYGQPAPAPMTKSAENVSEKWWSSTSDLETRSHVSTDLSEYRCQSAASSNQIDGRPSSPKPSADGIAMEKSWAKKATSDSNRKSWPPPKENTSTFTKREEWQEPELGYKTSSKESRQEIEESPGGGRKKTSIQSESTLETRSWSSRENRTEETIVEKPPPPKPVIIYNAETIKVDHTINAIEEQSIIEKYQTECDVHQTESTEKMIYEELRAPGLVKSAAPTPQCPPVQLYHVAEKAPEPVRPCPKESYIFKGTMATAPKRPPVQLYHPTPEPVREVILEPGTPPEIGYVPPPMGRENKLGQTEKIVEITRAAPPLPPKDARITPPPIPAKTVTETRHSIQQTSQLRGQPTIPTKFVKGTFVESDYESDFEGRSKWRPYESDSEEPRYRRVQAPTSKQPTRPKSTDPEPLPPSSFEVPPPELTGPPRPTVTRDFIDEPTSVSAKKVTSSMTRNERNVKQQQQQQQNYQTSSQSYTKNEQVTLKPGSPPVYVQPPRTTLAPRSPPAKTAKPESPKFKTRIFQQESGYMADTDEPLQRGLSQKSFGRYEGSTTSSTSESRTAFSESRSQYIESQTFSSANQRKDTCQSSSSYSASNQCQSVPKSQTQRSTYVEKSYGTSTAPGTTCCSLRSKPNKQETFYSMQKSAETKKVPTAPSPSTFARGEFRESDYESDYEGRIPPLWKPRGASSDVEDYSFKPVKPNLVNPGKSVRAAPVPTLSPMPEIQTQQRSMESNEVKNLRDYRSETFGKFEEKKTSAPLRPAPEIPRPTPIRQKSVLLPGSPPEIAYAPPRPHSYYEGRAGVPFHNAIGTELKKTVRMDESTENSRRIVTVEQTSRVIKFGENSASSQEQDSSAFDQRQKSRFNVPKPTKFIQGQFRESDYESDADVGRIRPKWTPADSDTEDPQYRKVQPPRFSRASSLPPPTNAERVVTPMEFDSGPPAMSRHSTSFEQHLRRLNEQSETLRRSSDMKKRFEPPQETAPSFGYVSSSNVKTAANHVASKHMTDMTSSFKSKTEKFVNDIHSDLKQSKPILKHPTTDVRTNSADQSQTYREESRVAQYGTKHIDPDTGLIYFKYDFGYEFGIVLPGEGKKTVASSSNSVQGQRRASDIDVPIVHEFTSCRENGYSKSSSKWQQPARNFPTKNGNVPSNFTSTSKSVKWEPTSESEFSEAEDSSRKRAKKHGNLMPPPPCLVIPQSPTSPRWDPTTPSPMSLSPSLPSFSPRHSNHTGPPSNVDSIAESPWSSSNGVGNNREVIQPYLDVQPKKAPLFITPLRDIAVLMGQTARFECIVQAEPQPNIIWSRNGRIIENSSDYEIYYRNGVCRLVIPRAYDDDAGTWACTATNALGSTGTAALLQIAAGNRASIFSRSSRK